MPEQDQIQPGQEYRLNDGSEVIVGSIEGDDVHGNVRPAGTTTGPTVALAVWVRPAADLLDAELIAPLWRIAFYAPVKAKHPNDDPVFQALAPIIESRSVPRIDPKTPEGGHVQGAQAWYVCEVAAPDEAAAKDKVEKVLEPVGGATGDINATQTR